jgi:hypothetical protein
MAAGHDPQVLKKEQNLFMEDRTRRRMANTYAAASRGKIHGAVSAEKALEHLHLEAPRRTHEGGGHALLGGAASAGEHRGEETT